MYDQINTKLQIKSIINAQDTNRKYNNNTNTNNINNK